VIVSTKCQREIFALDSLWYFIGVFSDFDFLVTPTWHQQKARAIKHLTALIQKQLNHLKG